MYGNNPVELRKWIFFDRHDWAVVAGVVDENADAAELRANVVDNPSALVLVLKIGGREICAAAGVGDFMGCHE